jgi:hypothetical protein
LNPEDTYAELAAQVEFPEAWIPTKGETLVGQVVSWENVNRDDKTCPVIVVKTPDGVDRSFWLWHAQARYKLIAPKEVLGWRLEDAVTYAGPYLAEVGDFIAISFAGMNPMADGKDAASYRVAIKKPTAGDVDPNYNQLPDGF